jgi:hypothetical protein
VENKESVLNNQLPPWINRFVLILFLITISIPVAVLILVRQPVYTEQAFFGVMKDKLLIINYDFSASANNTLKLNQQVVMIIQMNRQGEGKKKKISATVKSMDVNKESKICTLQLSSVEIDELLSHEYALNHPIIANANIEGTIMLNNGSATLLSKIFH